LIIPNGAGDWLGWRCSMAVSSAIAIRWRIWLPLMVSLSHEGRVALSLATFSDHVHLPFVMTLYISDAGEIGSENNHFADIGGAIYGRFPYPVFGSYLL